VRATDILSAPRGGTDLGAALTAALQALPQAGERGAAVVLVTDGEDLEGHGERVALECQRRGIPVHCVAFGTRAGSKITVEEGGKETFLRDRAGQEVVSAVDLAGLRRIAALTGGEFLDSSRDSLTDLSDASLRRSAHAAAGDEPRARKNRFQWPLSLAFGLWLTELCTLERKRR